MKTIRALLLGALLAFIPAAASSRAELFPPLPGTIPSDSGDVPVLRPVRIACPDTVLTYWGCWTQDQRKLEVLAGLPPRTAQRVLEHERIHMILGDARLSLPDTGMEQKVADAVAFNRMLVRLAGNP